MKKADRDIGKPELVVHDRTLRHIDFPTQQADLPNPGNGRHHALNREGFQIRPAVETDFETSRMPTNTIQVSASMSLNAEQMRRVRFGLVPKEMDDRWFVFFEDPHLFISRSWQHKMFYCADFEESEDGGGELRKIVINADVGSTTKQGANHARKLVRFIIMDLLVYGSNGPGDMNIIKPKEDKRDPE